MLCLKGVGSAGALCLLAVLAALALPHVRVFWGHPEGAPGLLRGFNRASGGCREQFLKPGRAEGQINYIVRHCRSGRRFAWGPGGGGARKEKLNALCVIVLRGVAPRGFPGAGAYGRIFIVSSKVCCFSRFDKGGSGVIRDLLAC